MVRQLLVVIGLVSEEGILKVLFQNIISNQFLPLLRLWISLGVVLAEIGVVGGNITNN